MSPINEQKPPFIDCPHLSVSFYALGLDCSSVPYYLSSLDYPLVSFYPSSLDCSSIPFYPLGLDCLLVSFYPSGWLRRNVNHALYSHSPLGRKVLVGLPNIDNGLHLVPHHLRVLHSCISIWKELVHHVQRSFYIFVSFWYGKKSPKISEH